MCSYGFMQIRSNDLNPHFAISKIKVLVTVFVAFVQLKLLHTKLVERKILFVFINASG